MPYFQNTPESHVSRSDSKNPATTCKGITSNGRACRRGLSSTPRASPTPSPSRASGVLAVLHTQGTASDIAAFYCWQHKDQAEHLIASDPQTSKLHPLKEKTSVDTLIDKLGVLDLDESIAGGKGYHPRRKRRQQNNVTRRDTLPERWHNLQGPLMTVPEHVGRKNRPAVRPPAGRSNTKASIFCCIQADDDDLPPSRRHGLHHAVQPDVVQTQQYKPPSPPTMQRVYDPSTPPRFSAGKYPSTPARPPLAPTPTSGRSQTQSLLSMIPPSLPPQTTSLLLSELSKPISAADEEGYIYMFWLTPEAEQSKPDDDVASSLLDPVDAAAAVRRGSEALNRYASTRRTPTKPQTVLLKIGRAANVHRRLSQWTKQCSYNITLIRYYPYNDNAPPSGATVPPRKVPHVHRVERLIHVELGEKKVVDRGPCENCGKEHREWFEVEASRKGLRAVDEVIKRWVKWAEQQSVP